jgi:hydroxymethylpyrimidine pyrophosphatase-like HAD family hydrolase
LKKLIVFDLDGTLAPSKSPLDAEMSTLLHVLLGVVRVAGHPLRGVLKIPGP